MQQDSFQKGSQLSEFSFGIVPTPQKCLMPQLLLMDSPGNYINLSAMSYDLSIRKNSL